MTSAVSPSAYLSWSTGKDCAFALLEARRLGLADVVGVLTSLSQAYDRITHHGVRQSVLDRQLAALGLPCRKIFLPLPCSMADYETIMTDVTLQIQAQGVTHIMFGDLFLEPLRLSRETKLASVGMAGLFPLWKRDTAALARAVIDSGMIIHTVCVNASHLDASFVGRRFDYDFLASLPAGVDHCGENGEFHTVVSGGPMFDAPFPLQIGEVVIATATSSPTPSPANPYFFAA
ncbi:MAG TPA: hypothetical protein VGL95_01580 [Acetobacteraceae bacterium]